MTDNNFQDHFLNIFAQNIGIIYKIARAYTKTYQDREDLINDISLELWKSFERFKGDSKVSTWIYRVALNTSLNYNRKRRNVRLLSYGDTQMKDCSACMADENDSSMTDILYQCIEDLSALDKAIILLYMDGNSHHEISDITGISKTNVGTRIGRIKEQIKKMIINKK